MDSGTAASKMSSTRSATGSPTAEARESSCQLNLPAGYAILRRSSTGSGAR